MIRTSSVSARTTLILSRFRFHLTTVRGEAERQLLVEQAALHGFSGDPANPTWLDEASTLELLEAIPTANVTPRQATEFLVEAMDHRSAWWPWLHEALEEAKDELLHQHRAAREAATATGRFRAEAVTPMDVLGLYVLLPHI